MPWAAELQILRRFSLLPLKIPRLIQTRSRETMRSEKCPETAAAIPHFRLCRRQVFDCRARCGTDFELYGNPIEDMAHTEKAHARLPEDRVPARCSVHRKRRTPRIRALRPLSQKHSRATRSVVQLPAPGETS